MEGIAIKVDQELEKELGTLFRLMFDGWLHAGVHYVVFFAVFATDGELCMPLLDLSPITDESQIADVHINMFENILGVYNKTTVMVFFGGGRQLQQKLVKMGILVVGCASHRFNLTVKEYLAPHETLLAGVNDFMVELRRENNAAELKKYTELLPVKRNVQRWPSTFTMVKRNIRILPDIKKLEAVEEPIPTSSKHRKLVALFE
ncbi:hypothetical protein PR003_g26587 [Phytophthora rubi]|uniref:Uncharacterized protein n=1 Tax=Phytophthora rubi TaxID=129364 RepID=A0A6A4C529_9STRA|nr:hypothetical protein PR003_g26587 [Phytophthora rubi]